MMETLSETEAMLFLVMLLSTLLAVGCFFIAMEYDEENLKVTRKVKTSKIDITKELDKFIKNNEKLLKELS